MTKLKLLVAMFAIVAAPSVGDAQGRNDQAGKPIKIEKDTSSNRDNSNANANSNSNGNANNNGNANANGNGNGNGNSRDESVPAPPLVALLAAGATVAGVTRWRQRQASNSVQD
jgi:hypothetical protein